MATQEQGWKILGRRVFEVDAPVRWRTALGSKGSKPETRFINQVSASASDERVAQRMHVHVYASSTTSASMTCALLISSAAALCTASMMPGLLRSSFSSKRASSVVTVASAVSSSTGRERLR